MTLKLSDASGAVACVMIPPESQGWKTAAGPKWTFKDASSGILGDPDANEALTIQFNSKTGLFEVKAAVTRVDLVDPEPGQITTSVTIGTHELTTTNTWRSTSKGKKLVSP